MTKTIFTNHGESRDFFYDSLKLETDDCILWKYAKYPGGYGSMNFNNRTTRVHRIALVIKCGEPPIGKPHALHSCRNRNCFNYRHLRWGTSKENMHDKIKDNTNNVNRGENHGRAKLTEQQVLSIRAETKRLFKDIAEDYGVSSVQISKIIKGDAWKSVPQENRLK